MNIFTLCKRKPRAEVELRILIAVRHPFRPSTPASGVAGASVHINEIPPEIQRIVLLKRGKIVADGEKHKLLNSQNLSDLFEIKLRVIQSDGFFLAHPG